MEGRRGPIGRTAGEPIFSCLTFVIDGAGLLCECGALIKAIDVDDGAGTSRGLADGSKIHAAAPAN